MKFTVERDVLAEAVGWTARSLPLRPTSPVLNGLLIKATSGEVSISSFDHEISAKQTIEASVEQEGTCLVPGKMLAEICRSLPNADVEFVANDSTIFMTCRSAKFQLAGMPVADYPELPELPQISGTVDGAEFAKAVSQVQIAVSKDETLPLLTGIRLEISGSTMTLLATDRYRLAMREITWNPENPEIEAAVLLKAKTMTEVGRTLSNSGELSIALPENGDLIGFSAGSRRTTSVLMDGQYPNLRALFPTETAVHAVVRTSDLAEAARRISLVAERNTPLRLQFTEDGQVSIDAGRGDEARASESMPAQLDGHEITVAYNPTYLSEGLGAFDTDFVRFSFTEAPKPAVLSGQDEPLSEEDLSYRYLVQPIRLPAN